MLEFAFQAPWLYGTIALFLLLTALLFAVMKFVGRYVADQQMERVHPPNARKLSAEDYEALCCRTGLSKSEISRQLGLYFFLKFVEGVFGGKKVRDGKDEERFASQVDWSRGSRVCSLLVLDGLRLVSWMDDLTMNLLRLYMSFMRITDGESHETAEKVIQEVPYFQGPLQDRMVSALKLPEEIDFVILASALSVFSEKTALDDKMRFLYRLYSSGTTGAVSREELTKLLDDVLPEFPDEEERDRLIERAVEGTFEELCGSSEDQELGMEQFQMAATPLIGERCTIFFWACQRQPGPLKALQNKRRNFWILEVGSTWIRWKPWRFKHRRWKKGNPFQ